MLEKLYSNQELDIEFITFTDNKQNIWFKGKDVAIIFVYMSTQTRP